MHIIIAGATGLIGTRLVAHWLQQEHRLTIVGRSAEKIKTQFGDQVEAVTWDDLTVDLMRVAQAVVNLAGASVGEQRWTEQRKQEMISSRIESTAHLAGLLEELGSSAPVWLNASAIGVYGLQQQQVDQLPPALTEQTKIEWDKYPDFLAQIGRQWECAAQPAVEAGVRVVFLRFGVVFAKEGGALPRIAQPVRMFMGGPIGASCQPFTWVAIDDVIRAIDFLLHKSDASGPYNIVAPKSVMQKELAESIATVLHRPHFMKTPAFMLKLMLGEQMATELVLEGQHVYPQRLLDAGFRFQYPDLSTALPVYLS